MYTHMFIFGSPISFKSVNCLVLLVAALVLGIAAYRIVSHPSTFRYIASHRIKLHCTVSHGIVSHRSTEALLTSIVCVCDLLCAVRQPK